MTHHHRDNFCIRMLQPNDVECPICGDMFTNHWLAVCGPDNVPVCELCAWEHATHLAGLAALSHAANVYYHDEYPPDVWERMEKRRNDPKRLKKELQKDHDSIGPNGPLGEFLKGQLKAALDGKDVEKLKSAKRLFAVAKRGISTVTDLDGEIPFCP